MHRAKKRRSLRNETALEKLLSSKEELETHKIELEMQNRSLRESQELLEESRSRYTELYDFAPIAYFTFDLNGRVRDLNLTAAKLLGRTRLGLIGKPFRSLVELKSEIAFFEHLRKSVRSDVVTMGELEFKTSKTSYVMQVTSAPFVLEDGSKIGCRSAFSDITARIQAEQRLRHAVQTRENFLAVVSHDLRNPLTSILLNSEMLLRSVPLQERRTMGRKSLENIHRSSKRMERMLSDLLDLSSMEAGHLSLQRGMHDVGKLIRTVREIQEVIANEKGIRLEISETEPLEAYVDRDRALQVLMNLVGNAMKFTPRGGAISIHARRQGENVLIQVTDTGRGIDPDQIEHVFLPYWTAGGGKKRGTGLGLAIARGIVAGHGGEIWVESRTGVGSTFSFTLPICPAGAYIDIKPESDPLQVEPAPPSCNSSGLRKTIMIAEDEESVRESLKEILERQGYQVCTASNGLEALGYLRDPNSGQTHLILMDLRMPEMDGWAFIRERNRDPVLSRIPVVVVSSQPNVALTVKSLNVAECISKPIELEYLFRTIERHLMQ
jgi:PAS domain S-box-containing protein